MSKWGKVDYRQFIKLQNSIAIVSNKLNMDAFYEACCKELAARLLALVIPKTPVGQYKKSSGKKGGTLRKGWGDPASYSESLKVTKADGTYTVEIINPIEYASYVEYGHSTVNGGWVEGKYMLSISEEKLKEIEPQILEKKLHNYLKEVFND